MADWLTRQLRTDGSVVVHAPYVIGGDLAIEELTRRYQESIDPAGRAIIGEYLHAPPSRPTVILLARGEASYRRFADRLFGIGPESDFGFYRPHVRMLLVNTARGESGLVHELTHALLTADLPSVPEWFNEGLASLHEDSRLQDGVLVGQDNWRLPILQEAIRSDRFLSLESLVRPGGFRSRPIWLSYAQARYFCMFMQQRGVLRDCCRLLRGATSEDPSGMAAISQAFGGEDLDRIDAEFRRWALRRGTDATPPRKADADAEAR
ncbi:MAG: hypothetical protein HUU20_26110 [Pirellulales bacterium]|nr:hypothetical protein [Pirellulales bacterium]